MITDGIVVVDKPAGPTSHDVVQTIRRRLHTRRVGHAGTLDPAATGVLVILVGEATKLGPYLSADDKRYEATVAFGVATATLDAEGAETARIENPAWLVEELAAIARGEPAPRIARALEIEIARTSQVPPEFSAIKVDGRRSYDNARRGVAEPLPPRPVVVRSIAVRCADPDQARLTVELHTGKGYYVRAFARDLGEGLGGLAHLATLRRTGSGAFSIAEATRLDDPDLSHRITPLAEAARRGLPHAVLTEAGAARARVGRGLEPADFATSPPEDERSFAWLDAAEVLVAIGHRVASEGLFRVDRGFSGGGPIAGGGVAPVSSDVDS